MASAENFSIEEKFDNLTKVVLDLSKKMHAGFGKVDENFESIGYRLELIDKRIELLLKDSNDGFSTVGEKIDQLKQEVHKIQKVSNYTEEYENLLRILK
jgi:DNA anti-recombination protein RmuC